MLARQGLKRSGGGPGVVSGERWQWRGRTLHKVTEREGATNLPAGLEREAGDSHAVDSATRARSHARLVATVIVRAIAAPSELDDQTLTHELGTV